MKYFRNSINFTMKNSAVLIFVCIISIAPLLVIDSIGLNFITISKEFTQIVQDMSAFDFEEIFRFAQKVGTVIAEASAAAAIIQLVLQLLIMPAVYGMTKKGIETGNTDFGDFVPALRQNIVKYLLYILGLIIFCIVTGIIAAILMILLGLLTSVIGDIGFILIIIAAIALVCFLVYIGMMLRLWFPAMLIDNLGVMQALKAARTAIKGVFWKMLLVHLLTGIVIGIVNAVLMELVGEIMVVGPLIKGTLNGLSATILLVFVMFVYYGDAKDTSAETEQKSEA